MKKTFPININGTIFYIDEDAYNLLNTYLNQLHRTFGGDEGKEITTDIEARMAEHFAERIAAGAAVIVLDDVNNVIEIMGRPEELSDADDDADGGGARPHGKSGATAAPGQAPSDRKERPVGDHGGSATPPPYGTGAAGQPPVKRLYRCESNKVFGGVISGLGIYLGWNINLMRVLYIVVALCTYFWPCVVIYLVAWMIIPAARTPRQILEMNGAPVTVGSVGRTVLGTADPTANASGPVTVTSVLSILGKIVMGFLGLIAVSVGFAAVIFFIVALCGLIAYCGWDETAIITGLDLGAGTSRQIIMGAVGGLMMSLALLTPCIAMAWGACCALFKARGASKSVIIMAIILEVIFAASATILLNLASADLGLMGSAMAGSLPLVQMC